MAVVVGLWVALQLLSPYFEFARAATAILSTTTLLPAKAVLWRWPSCACALFDVDRDRRAATDARCWGDRGLGTVGQAPQSEPAVLAQAWADYVGTVGGVVPEEGTSIDADELADAHICQGKPAVIRRCATVDAAAEPLALVTLLRHAAGDALVDVTLSGDYEGHVMWPLRDLVALYSGELPTAAAVAEVLATPRRQARGDVEGRRDGDAGDLGAVDRLPATWAQWLSSAQTRTTLHGVVWGDRAAVAGTLREDAWRPRIRAFADALLPRWQCHGLGSELEHLGGSMSEVFFSTRGPGYRSHYDARSVGVFVLQGVGRKDWYMWPAESPLFVPALRVSLSPGDLLYLPVGWLHNTSCASNFCVTLRV